MERDYETLLEEELGNEEINADEDYSLLFYEKSYVDELLDSMKKYLNH